MIRKKYQSQSKTYNQTQRYDTDVLIIWQGIQIDCDLYIKGLVEITENIKQQMGNVNRNAKTQKISEVQYLYLHSFLSQN